MNNNHFEGAVYSVAIQLNIQSATSAVRFPCLFSVQWRTNDLKVNIQTGRHSPSGSKTEFNQNLVMRTELIFDKNKKCFLKKQTQVQLNLVSKSRPDQPKLVGRVTVDLAGILNQEQYTLPTQFTLQFCSVNASLNLCFKVLEKTQTDISINEFQKSYGDVLSMNGIKLINLSGARDCSRQVQQELSPRNNLINKQTMNTQIHREADKIISPKNKKSIMIDEPAENKKQQKIVTVTDIQPAVEEKIISEIRPISKSFRTVGSFSQEKKSSLLDEFKPSTIKEQTASSLSKIQYSSQIIEHKQTDSRIIEEMNKQKQEIDKIKYENERHKNQGERYRQQVEKHRQEVDQVKSQMKQKQLLLDQSWSQNAMLKGEISKMREDNTKNMQQSVNLSLKLAEIRQINNKLTSQLALSEREVKRLEGVNELVQKAQGAKGELSIKLNSYENQLRQYHSRCAQLLQEKNQLQQFLLTKDRQNQESQQNNLSTKRSLQGDIVMLQQEINVKNEQINSLSETISQLNRQLEKLGHLSSQFQEAKHSWDITKGIFEDQAERKSSRVKQLEETLLSLADKIKWLEGESELLTENNRQSREEYLKISQQKTNQYQSYRAEKQKLIQQITKVQQQLQSQFSVGESWRIQLQAVHSQKQSIQTELNSLHESYNILNSQYDNLQREFQTSTQQYARVTASLQEMNMKCNQLQELLINTSDQKNRQIDQANLKQRELIIKVAELQGDISRMNDILANSGQRLVVLQSQIKDRQEMIVRLQGGLRSQVERSQELNNKIMSYIEREQRYKQKIQQLQMEAQTINQLIVEQQIKELENAELLNEKQKIIEQLLTNLEGKINHCALLQKTITQKDQFQIINENSLNGQISKYCQHIHQLQEMINSKQQIIQEQLKYNQANKRFFEQQIINHSSTIQNNCQQLDALQQAHSININSLAGKEQQIVKLTDQLNLKLSELQELSIKVDHLSKELDSVTSSFQTAHQSGKLQLKQWEQKYNQLVMQKNQIENQLILKTQLHLEDVNKLSAQNNQLKSMNQTLINDKQLFDINNHRQQMNSQLQEISKLQSQIKLLKTQAAKVSGLERTIKIKTIQLNSLKMKGKGSQVIEDHSSSAQLLKLKDQQIAQLILERDRLLVHEGGYKLLEQKIIGLTTDLQILEEQKFNTQSLANERALALEDSKQQNRKLVEQITIFGERNGQLQRTLQQLINKQGQSLAKNADKGVAALKAQNMLLRNQTKELQQLKNKVIELEQIRNKLKQQLELREDYQMVNILQKQIKQSNTQTQANNPNTTLKKSIHLNDSNSKATPNIGITLKNLKELIDNRFNNKSIQKLIQSIDSLLRKQTKEHINIIEKIRILSREFQKLKVKVVKSGQGKGTQQKIQTVEMFKICQLVIADTLKSSEQIVSQL